MAQTVRLGLIGFGNVAQGLAQILRERADEYEARFGLRFSIVAIADQQLGCALDAQGLDPARLLEAATQLGGLGQLSTQPVDWDGLGLVCESPADVIVELSFTNLQTGEPATSYIAEALRRKKHVVTTNKGPVALHYQELARLAQQNGVKLGVEGTVMSGTPTLRLGRELLAGAGIRSIQGILNGTTNFILTQMEAGGTYVEALAQAQQLGYAEADPTGDVEGFDAAGKVVILAQLLFGVALPFSAVDRQGITRLTPADITQAQSTGARWKLIGALERDEDGSLRASVGLQCLPVAHPLAGVSGATNAITFTTDLLGQVTLIGPGAGRLQTGYAVIEDLLGIYA